MNQISFSELCDKMRTARKNGKEITGVIVFKSSNWEKEFSLEARSYVVSNMCNYFDDEKISQALWGTSIDKSDKNVRLDYYLYDWEIDYCYLGE